MKHGCYNRLPLKETLMVQDGWTNDGKKIMVEIPFLMNKNCQYTREHYADESCSGCKWQKMG